MYRNAPPGRNRNDQADGADVYWRRRFFALAAGLSVLGVLVWALSGMTGGHQSPGTADGGNGSGNGQAPAAYRSPVSGAAPSPTAATTGGASTSSSAATPGATPAASGAMPASAYGRERTSGAATPAGSTGAVTTGTQASTAGNGGRCPSGDVVLSLTTATTSYTAHRAPMFHVDVVSTDSATCSYDIGPAALTMTVRSKTGVAWRSNACARKPTAKTVKLHRGVPDMVTISWNRTLSVDGCGKGAATARPGSYQAVARDGSAVSRSQAFQLR